MTTCEMIDQLVRDLPAEKQREVLDFVEFLHSHAVPKRPLRDLVGLWRGFDVSPEDISEVRREMWSGFPHEDL